MDFFVDFFVDFLVDFLADLDLDLDLDGGAGDAVFNFFFGGCICSIFSIQTRCLQSFFHLPAPPNLGLSKQ